MTHTTEQERAEFEAWAAKNYHGINLEHEGRSYRYSLANEWWTAWQAARRAPAVPVPQGLREAAQAVVERWDTPLWKDVPATAVYIADLRAALAAAPQPPEAAPVRKPLTEEELLQTLHSLSVEPPKRLPPGWIEFARAIERVHGIT